jgi:hypothetical protein
MEQVYLKLTRIFESVPHKVTFVELVS